MKNIRSRSVYLLLILATLAVSAAANPQLDAKVRSIMEERHIPGAAVAVIKNGRVVKMSAYGLASLEFNVPVTTETVFEIGSVSKQMTAAAIMLLVQDGKVSLDERISRYLPNTPEAWRDVTVRHLLAHSSGIKSYSSLEGFELARRMTVKDFIEKLAPHPLEFTPGERNIYSNSGFNLLAFIIESQSGKKYLEFMRERIFLPLGMTKTGDRDPRFIIPLRAQGYEWIGSSFSGRDGSLTDLTGAGSVTSTIADMVKWEAALRGDKFLNAQSKREIWTQFRFNNGELSPYGLGWRISEVRGHDLIAHSGQTAGFGAAIHRYVKDDVTAIALTNLGEVGMGTILANAAAKAYVPGLSLTAAIPEVTPAGGAAETVAKGLADRYEKQPNAALFSAQFARGFNTERARTLREKFASFAPVVSIRHIKSETSRQRTTVTSIVKTARRHFLWRTTLDESGSIIEMSLDDEE